MIDERLLKIKDAAKYVKALIGERCPEVGIVLGSGLGRLVDRIEDQIIIPYREIPFFPVSTAVGHKGNFICGFLGGKCVLAMQGRFHYYEGYAMEEVTLGIRVMKALGVEYLFVSNAAGACNPDFRTGDIAVIYDHISNIPNPLIGRNFEELGPRFPDMTCAYDQGLQKLAYEQAQKLGIKLQRGVYFASTGPTYETPAEVRFYRMIGADLLGMSTVPEVIVARHAGIKVFGVSVVTNCSNFQNVEKNLNDANDVVEQADHAAEKLSELFASMIERL